LIFVVGDGFGQNGIDVILVNQLLELSSGVQFGHGSSAELFQFADKAFGNFMTDIFQLSVLSLLATQGIGARKHGKDQYKEELKDLHDGFVVFGMLMFVNL